MAAPAGPGVTATDQASGVPPSLSVSLDAALGRGVWHFPQCEDSAGFCAAQTGQSMGGSANLQLAFIMTRVALKATIEEALQLDLCCRYKARQGHEFNGIASITGSSMRQAPYQRTRPAAFNQLRRS